MKERISTQHDGFQRQRERQQSSSSLIASSFPRRSIQLLLLFVFLLLTTTTTTAGRVEHVTDDGSSSSSNGNKNDNDDFVVEEPSMSSSSSSQLPPQSQKCTMDHEGLCEDLDVISRDIEILTEAAKTAEVQEVDDDEVDDDDEGLVSESIDDDDNDNDDNDVWSDGTPWDIASFLKCDEDKWVSAHTNETWKFFTRTYNGIVLDGTNSIHNKTFERNGFQYEIEIKFHPQIGRGVFTKVPIPKGGLVYQSTNTAEFVRAQDYRTFLRRLPPPLACDVIVWAYSRMVSREQSDTYMACVDLDEGSFLNSGTTDDECNIELGIRGRLLVDDDDEDATWYGCQMQFYANRDIAVGEEIRPDYANFAEPHGWSMMGL